MLPRTIEHLRDNPPTSSNIYSPLNAEKEIRLLAFAARHPSREPGSLSCSLVKAELIKAPKYTAISYVWGERPYSYEVIDIDGTEVAIPAKAGEALRYLHGLALSALEDGDIAFLWIDAVCIDQGNDVERAQQVAIMSDIYSRATKVLVFLGPELTLAGDDDMDERSKDVHAKLFMMELSSAVQRLRVEYSDRHTLNSGLDIHTALPTTDLFSSVNKADLIQYFSSTWFVRHWIIQEVALSQKAAAVYGSLAIPLADVLTLARWLKKLQIREWIPGANAGFLKSLYGCTTLYWMRNSRYCRHNLAHEERECRKGLCYDALPLWWLLQTTFESQTTDMRDKVYGVLGLCGPEIVRKVQPDYSKSLSRVYADATRASFQETASFDLMTYARVLGNKPDSWYADNKWPTWVALLQKLGGNLSVPTSLPRSIYNSSDGLNADVSSDAFVGGQTPTLQCRGVTIDTISYVSESRQPGGSQNNDFVEQMAMCLQLASQHVLTRRDESPLVALALTLAGGYLPVGIDVASLNEQTFLELLANQGPGQDAANELTIYSMHRSVFFTRQGYIGLGSQYIQDGDEVIIPFGSRLPWVVRRVEDGKRICLGVCYLHTVMNGEFIKSLITSGKLGQRAEWFDIV